MPVSFSRIHRLLNLLRNFIPGRPTRMIFRCLFAGIILLISFNHALAQEVSYRFFGTNDGLPGGRVYSVAQDKNGYLWCTTQSGISRFDGTRFRNFSIDDGYTDRNGAFRVFEDKEGRIWFVPFNGKACYFYADSFHVPEFIKKENVSWVTQSTDGTLLFATRTGHMIRHTSTGKTTRTSLSNLTIYDIAALNDSVILYCSNNSVTLFNISTGMQKVLFPSNFNLPFKQGFIRLHRTPGNIILITTSESIYQISQDQVVKPFFTFKELQDVPEFLTLYSENDSILWMPSRNGTTRVVYKNDKLISTERFLKDVSALSILCDTRKNVWFATSLGLFRSTTLAVRYLNNKNGLYDQHLKMIEKTSPGKFFIISEMGSLYEYTQGKLSPKEKFNDIFLYRLYLDDTVICNATTSYVNLFNGKYSSGPGPQARIRSPSGTNFIYQSWGVETIKNGTRTESRQPFWIGFPIMLAINDSNVWMGSQSGIYLFDGKNLNDLSGKNGFPPGNISDIKQDRFGRIWIATSGYGVFLKTRNKVINLRAGRDRITDNYCNNIYLEKNGDVWLCNNTGLNRLVLDKDGTILNIKKYNTTNSFVSGEVHDIAIEGHTVYAATNDGLAILDLNRFEDKQGTIPVVINGVYVNNKLISRDLHQFDHNQNAIEFDFTAINLGAGRLSYSYRLLPSNENWISTRNNFARFDALPPGEYTFEVAGKVEDEFLGNTVSYSFTIKPPYWKRPLFYLPLTLASSLMLFAGVRYRVSRARQKVEIQRNLLESELKVLRLQMNPHFLFNTLQSIQDFVIRKQGDEAIRYLSKFSKLVRMILSYSKKSQISLQEELEFLNYYVELEQMRNPGGFTFTSEVSESLDVSEIYIPPMIIQPFMENSIKHAMGKDKGNHIHLGVFDHGDYIRIVIEDNGNGISNQYQRKDHESSGISITGERIRRLTGINKTVQPLKIENLTENGTGKGTRITIALNKVEI